MMSSVHSKCVVAAALIAAPAVAAAATAITTETFPYNQADAFSNAVTTVSGRFTLLSFPSPIQGIAGTAEESSTQGFGIDIERSYPALAPIKMNSVTLDSGP